MKIKFIIKLFTLTILFFVFTKSSFAAEINSNLFDFSTVTKSEQIKAPSETDTKVGLLPFTTIIIRKGSFQEDVKLSVYEGNFDKIRALLPKGQSPISSYYFVFKNQKGLTVFPSVPITIQSVNNYSDTDTFYYTLLPDFTIDKKNQQKWNGNGNLAANLPIKNSGFILATNKNLNQNDPALNVAKNKVEPQPNTPLSENKIDVKTILPILTTKLMQDSLLPIVGILVIIAGLICITIWLIWKKRKSKSI